ncbi:MAG: antibiotic biosynthesis monooxygenase [Hyphomonas sp.]|jgi:quinol monooxygenase YgiN|nr:antibiotic biosynthesis monooxygenase [Hyphomonas sp.]
MGRYALIVHLEAKSGREDEVAALLVSARASVEREAGTIAWFAGRLDTQRFVIFDTFDDEAGRAEHLSGPVAAALSAAAEDLFATAPDIRMVDLLAEKLP